MLFAAKVKFEGLTSVSKAAHPQRMNDGGEFDEAFIRWVE
jgi:hypothetical protein